MTIAGEIYELKKCAACGLRYDARGRAAECPHALTAPEPAYFARLRARGAPYKIAPGAAEDETLVTADADTR